MKKIYLTSLFFLVFLLVGGQEKAIKSFDYKEKVFVHTNSSEFFVGQEIDIAFYLLDYQDNSIPLSQVGYVDVVNQKGSIVFSTTIALQDGVGKGSIFIPSSTSTGNYTLVGYSKWILKSGVGAFQSEITLINPFRTYINPNTPSAKIDYQIVGNRLVSDIENQVYYKVENAPERFSIQIQSNEGEIMSTSKKSNGNMIFVPKNDVSYSMSLFDSVTQVRKTRTLPNVIRSGMTAIFNSSNDRLYFTHNDGNSQLSIQCQVKNKIGETFYDKIVENPDGKFELDLSGLDNEKGIFRMSCLNSKNNNVLLEFFILKGNQDLIPESSPNYLTNEEVSFSLDDLFNDAKPRSISISIRKQNIASLSNNSNLESHVSMISEIENGSPTYPFINEVNWDKSNTSSLLPDFRGLVFSANSKSGTAFGDENVAFSTPSQAYFANNFTDTDGNANFLVNLDVSQTSYITKEGLANEIPVFKDVSYDQTDLIAFNKPSPLVLDTVKLEMINDRMIHIQIANAFKKQQSEKEISENDNLMFYGEPNNSFILDEYTRFPSMEEVIKEIVFGLRLRGDQDSPKLTVASVLGQVFTEAPLVLFNSIPVNDHSSIVSLDPLKVSRVEVVREKYFLNDRVYGGIVHFIPFDQGMILGQDSKLVPLNLLPESSKVDNSIPKDYPDYRDQLYWNIFSSSKEIPQQVNFSTSNNTGDFTITIQGVLENNEPFSYYSQFKVK